MDRNEIIYYMRCEGSTFVDIGRLFFISTSRARQIFDKENRNRKRKRKADCVSILSSYKTFQIKLLLQIKDDILNIANQRTDKIKKIVYDYDKSVS